MATYEWAAYSSSSTTGLIWVDQDGRIIWPQEESSNYEIENFGQRMKRLQKEKAEREQFEREMAEFCEWDQQED